MIYSHISELIGNTPVVRLSGFEKSYGLPARIAAKIESFNPLGSAKDRIAREMLETAIAAGQLKPGMCIVEPTSGNTGVGLAYVARHMGYQVVLTMPDSMSVERRRLLSALGAELVLTPAADGMAGSVAAAKEIAAQRSGFIPDQFANPAGPAAHYKTTGPELWRDCDGDIAAFVCTVGTGGTITGTGRYLKEQNPAIKVFAVEPADSPLLSGGVAAPHKIQGIGANFIPDALNRSVYDEVITVTAEEAYRAARTAAREDGVLTGISSGAALHAASKIASRFAGQTVAVLLPDSGERYFSTELYEETL
ncbi:MAG: cysteine synthase A [Ruminococcaceae bacterium]|nr:cysteine synthase A [Oscillospiraceae bacterium]